MSIQHVAAVLGMRRKDIKAARRMVLIALANRTDEDRKCWPSQQLIADECGLETRAVQDHLKALEGLKIITRETVALGQGRGGRTIYVLHLDQLAHAENAPAKNAPAKNAHANFDSLHTQQTAPQEPTLEPTIDINTREKSSFDHFWGAYPKRITNGGKAVKLGKPQAQAEWKKLSLDDQRAAYAALKLYADASDGKPVDAERYLKRRLWVGLECEPPVAAPKPKHPKAQEREDIFAQLREEMGVSDERGTSRSVRRRVDGNDRDEPRAGPQVGGPLDHGHAGNSRRGSRQEGLCPAGEELQVAYTGGRQ